MGKKNKNKNKVSGSVKTACKTEKKLNAKQKKELAALGEDDIEKLLAQIEKDEAKRQKVVEEVIDHPSRRVNFSLTAHPLKDELIMLGGEFFDGKKTKVFGDMLFYNLNKKTWTVTKAPGAPPPRCGHQAVATPNNKGELWIFGGEFTSPSESQFYHYKDLWVFHIGDKKWEKILAPGGPSARSGHRMVYGKKQLIVFGGFHDNARDFKYHNDLFIFNLVEYKWNKIELSGSIPLPRSGCIVFPTSENKILIYGGYSKERVKKDVEKGLVHTDMFVLNQDKHDEKGLKWKSVMVKQSGIRVSPRCSASGVLAPSNLAYMFGGVYDDDEDEEDLHGTFFNDLIALDLEKHQWRSVNLSGKKDPSVKKRRRKQGEEGETEECAKDDEEEKEMEIVDAVAPVTTIDDGIFTVTVGPAPVPSSNASGGLTAKIFSPSPRINPGLAIKNNVLFLYGGMYEADDRQFTLNDFYSLDLHKLDEWQTITTDDLSSQIWLDSESSSSGSEDSDSDDSEESEEDMEIDN